ncbi:MAG: hypothetical protein R3E78_17815 [Burkholderiaceae bacterium]
MQAAAEHELRHAALALQLVGEGFQPHQHVELGGRARDCRQRTELGTQQQGQPGQQPRQRHRRDEADLRLQPQHGRPRRVNGGRACDGFGDGVVRCMGSTAVPRCRGAGTYLRAPAAAWA